MNPIDVKRLSFHMYPHVVQQMSNPLHQMNMPVQEPKSEMAAKSELVEDEMMELDMECDMVDEIEKIPVTDFDMVNGDYHLHRYQGCVQ